MSWSAETRCLHCDGKLPLFRKLTSGQFCSAAHAKAYWKEQERLAVERLNQTHDSLRAYRPAGAIEAILGPGAADNPFYKDGYFDSEQVEPTLPDTVLAPTNRAAAAPPPVPFYIEEVARRASNFDAVSSPGFLRHEMPDAAVWRDVGAHPTVAEAFWVPLAPVMPGSALPALNTCVAMASSLSSAYLRISPEDVPTELRLKDAAESVLPKAGKFDTQIVFHSEPVTPELDMPLPVAEAPEEVVVEPLAEVVLDVAPEAAPPPMAPMLEAVKIPSVDVSSRPACAAALLQPNVPTQRARFDVSLLAEGVPQQSAGTREASWAASSLRDAKMAALPVFAAADVTVGIRSSVQPAETKSQVELTRVEMNCGPAELRGPAMAWLVSLPIEGSSRPAPAAPFLKLQPQPANLRSGSGAPVYALHADECPLRWKLASGIRYPVTVRDQNITVAAGPNIQPLVADALPLEMPCDTTVPVSEPSAAWLMPLPFVPGDPRPAPDFVADQRSVIRSQSVGPEPKAPASRLTTIQGTLEPQSRFSFLAAAARNAAGALEPKFALTNAVDFWKNAPRDLKLLVFAIPTLMALALHPSLPKFRVTPTANAAAQAPSDMNSAMRVQFQNVRQTVAGRAGVELTEDFRAGLDSWQSRGDLSTAWSFDSNGFVRPGMLALYQPSLKLQDYEMNFLGLIDKKALSFVARAQDFDNYYVIKIVILKPGPLPTVGITRYAVIDGKPQDRKDVVAPINARPDMLYRVSLNIHDDTFLLQMQGKIVDSWTEARLTHGGVGFFSASGEESRLRWVQVTHQYDMLGRLCAYLAPYNMPTKNGSW
ncbi:MAG: hypothetical protein ABL995_06885 [Bryobacteraceae bacterium]